jgi:hypothetical protein
MAADDDDDDDDDDETVGKEVLISLSLAVDSLLHRYGAPLQGQGQGRYGLQPDAGRERSVIMAQIWHGGK